MSDLWRKKLDQRLKLQQQLKEGSVNLEIVRRQVLKDAALLFYGHGKIEGGGDIERSKASE